GVTPQRTVNMWNALTVLQKVKGVAGVWAAEPHTVTLPHTALVVDDEEGVRHFVERVLQSAGYRTVAATDGDMALLLAKSHGSDIDVLVTDMLMPNMNGNELARRIRAKLPDLPVLYLTGFSDRLFDDHALLWENEAFLEKPCTIKGLLEAVTLLMQQPA